MKYTDSAQCLQNWAHDFRKAKENGQNEYQLLFLHIKNVEKLIKRRQLEDRYNRPGKARMTVIVEE